ncbi:MULTISPECIES: LysR family transcriptional regulator [Burkholderia]|uniref:LysR family transcriptional regulator n=1 Tax=Burkholderia TaxID=32008 RepID=UPI00093010D7|nr:MULTISPECIES: LysR family transcriptional regulator [Burkholderia]
MEISLLRSFLVLAATSNFGRAAVVLNLSQPALSRQINRLEEEIGGLLFSRGRRGAQLTELGRIFTVEARQFVEQHDALLERGRQIATGEVGELRIGFGFWAINVVTTSVLRFRHQYPDVRIRLEDLSSADQARGLADGSLDIAFMRLTKDKTLLQYPLAADYPVFVLPRDFPMADRMVSMKTLYDQPFVLIARDRAPDFHKAAMDLFERYGVRPNLVQEASEFYSVQALVTAGLGVSLMPASAVKLSIAGLRLRFVAASKQKWELGVAVRREQLPAPAKRFLNLLGID